MFKYITIHSVDFGIRKTKQHRTKQTNEKKNGYNYSKRNKLPLSLLGDLFVRKKYQLCTLCKELTLHILLWSVMYFYPAQQNVMLFRWLLQRDNCTGQWYCVARIKSLENKSRHIERSLGRRGWGCVVCGKGDGDWGLGIVKYVTCLEP